MIRIVLAQINPTVGDLAGNQRKILDYIQRAKKNGADMVVFPEMALCGYPPEDLLHKAHFVEDNIRSMKALIKKVKGIIAVVGFVDVDKSKNIFNAAAVMHEGRMKGIYRKEHLPNYGVFDEKRYFQSGFQNKIFATNGIPIGINICEDIWIDKGTYAGQVKMGARILINISSSPYDISKLSERIQLLTKRAKETKAFICYANLVGGQDELVFDGSSLVIDPKGNIVAAGKAFEEDLVMVDLEVPLNKKVNKKSGRIINIKRKLTKSKKPLKGNRSYSLPKQIECIYKALVLGTRDYIWKNKFQKVVIGLSGGIDSSLVAVIAVDAIGKDNVIGVTMPSSFSSEETQSDAIRVAENLGIKMQEISINAIQRMYLDSLKGIFHGVEPDITEENIQARIRGNLLMALSNKFGWLVLTTGNKSEIAVGYCTLYGDMSGGFAVIKDVPKTKVYELAVYKNNQGRELIPRSVILREPTAELRENQKDQDTLPSYNVLDAILRDYVEEHESLEKMSAKRDKRLIKKIITMVDRSEYKRRQAPPGIKITPRAFGKDWRLPITNNYKEF